jgi:Zn-finger nucleic acid-binding protein
MTCPNCGAAMSADTLTGHLGTSVSIDLCLACQMFWFDTHESLKLAPGAVLKLFRLIGEHALTSRAPTTHSPECPRCHIRLLQTHDQQRNTRFQYLRCPRNHGRLISFVDFLREKDFVRPLSPEQIAELRQNVQMVNCSNCGAPIDLTKGASCPHCGAPLSMLDLKRAGALVAELRESEQPRAIDPALPLELVRARREVEMAFAAFERGPGWFDDVSRGGLVGAGIRSLARWLKQQG